jgi:hypothetical protein
LFNTFAVLLSLPPFLLYSSIRESQKEAKEEKKPPSSITASFASLVDRKEREKRRRVYVAASLGRRAEKDGRGINKVKTRVREGGREGTAREGRETEEGERAALWAR